MEQKPDSEKLFPSKQYLPGECVANGMFASARSIAACIGTLDDVEAEMGQAIYSETRLCMEGQCTTNKLACKGPSLADLSMKLKKNDSFDPYYVKFHSVELSRYFATRSFETD
jgi:hypothetical protein